MGWRDPGLGIRDGDSVRSDNCLDLVFFYASYPLTTHSPLYDFRYVLVFYPTRGMESLSLHQ